MERPEPELTTGFEVKGNGIEFQITMPLSHAKSLKRLFDELSDRDMALHEDVEVIEGMIGSALECDLQEAVEELAGVKA